MFAKGTMWQPERDNFIHEILESFDTNNCTELRITPHLLRTPSSLPPR